MIQAIRSCSGFKFLSTILALYLLNISVDTPDAHPEHVAEDLRINDQESFVELLVETILGYEDAIAEYDDHDTEEQSEKKRGKTDLVFSDLPTPAHAYRMGQDDNRLRPRHTDGLIQQYFPIDTPPPRV